MDGYDQLWSLVEADGTDIVPGLVAELTRAAAGQVVTADLLVDLSALGIQTEAGTDFADILTGAVGGDDFFPVAALDAAFPNSVADSLFGHDVSGGEAPFVLPVMTGDHEIAPLVLPGVMDDDFLFIKGAGDPLVRPNEPSVMLDIDGGEFVLARFTSARFVEMPVDHSLHVDGHGLIGAHGSDDWLF